MAELERLGGSFSCTSNRETIMYQGNVFKDDLQAATDLLAEIVAVPLFTEDEVAEQKMLVGYEHEGLLAGENPDVLISELLHRAAFRGESLGTADQLFGVQEQPLVQQGQEILGSPSHWGVVMLFSGPLAAVGLRGTEVSRPRG